jgi:anhydro-N-acetylmuramic acid kinase
MPQLAIGLMSGTSLDGIDVALVRIHGNERFESATLVAGETIPYSDQMKQRIRTILDPSSCTAAWICSVHFELAEVYADAVLCCLSDWHVRPSDVAFIACHGQTVYHINDEAPYVPSSLQLGDGSVLALRTGIPVVFNFRNADIAAGGTGAPLVPYVDYLMFGDQGGLALHNIGGISNLTALSPSGQLADLIAFDTGPGNVLVNEAMELLYQEPYDAHGRLAQAGTVSEALVKDILSDPYFAQIPPKSTGRERFSRTMVAEWIQRYDTLSNEDIIASLTSATARSIANAYRDFVLPTMHLHTIAVAGGGLHNKTLLSMLRQELPDIDIISASELGIDPDFKEAMAFAILGYETMHQRPGNAPKATGANRRVVLGQICVPTKEEQG